ncbi:MAG TPA: adenosine deaminase [Phycicoccus elongatus]|mgnify:CR=1 FL=1|nr:adenosine deaminase [Phycicoccus elongatus]
MSELDREAEQAIDYLGDSEEQDNLPESPPDVRSRATEWGTTAAEQSAEETIDQRIAQEVPDPDSAYGAPRNESGLDDEIEDEDDYLGSGEVRTVADDESSAEEAAMHVIEDEG